MIKNVQYEEKYREQSSFPNIIDENQVVETEQCLVKIQVYSTINVPANYSGKS
jgi:hypothetical protein